MPGRIPRTGARTLIRRKSGSTLEAAETASKETHFSRKASARFFPGEGEMARRTRQFDWSRTPIGPIESWPQSLKTAVNLILNSQHPMWIGWGDEVTFLYNDAYIDVLSIAKHPWALGRPAAEVWSEIWDVCGPLVDKVFKKSEPSFFDDVRLFMNRGSFLEETYYSFSYSPIQDESGKTAGLFCPSAEVTAQILNTRRLGTLSELSANALVEKTVEGACFSASYVLSRNPDDIPFAFLYLYGRDRRSMQLQFQNGLAEPTANTIPVSVDIGGAAVQSGLWPISEVANTGRSRVFSVAGISPLPFGPAQQPVVEVIAQPVKSPGEHRPIGVLIAGVNPTRKLDAEYSAFYELVAAHLGTAVANARAYEEERRRSQGERNYMETHAARLHTRDGQIVELAVTHDVSQLAESATGRLAAIVESSDDAIISKNLNGVITSWNQSAERLFGYSAAEAIGQNITLIIPHDRRSEEQVILNRIRSGQQVDHFETLRRRKDGTLIELSLTISPVRDSNGRVIGASKIARDITERRQAERVLHENQERLRKTEKLAAAGQLAASLAHEINNPLSSVTNALYLLKNGDALPAGAQSLVDIASGELARMSRIVKQSLSYYRTGSSPKDVDIGALVLESLQVFSTKFDRADIVVTHKIIPGHFVSGFSDEIRQVIDNLLLNAVEAMPQGGRLRISVRPGSDSKHPDRKGIRLTIGDTGTGIPHNIRPRIFEPFFTTKPEKGTGLGLWVVRGLLAKHDGVIRVRSSERQGYSGTVISILWPHTGRVQNDSSLSRPEPAVIR